MPVANKGWIKIHRSILENDIWTDEEEPFCYRSAWIDLILCANYAHGNAFGKVPVSRGQYITSIRKLITKWHWHYRKVKRYLCILESEGMVSIDYQSKYLIVTIINYDKYQLLPNGNSNGNGSGNDTVNTRGNGNGNQYKNDKECINNNKEIKAPPFSSSGWGDDEPE